LVAYLDGELQGPAADAVERALTSNPGVRREAETLKRAWDLLDHLPRAEPSATFTSRTLERIEARPRFSSASAASVATAPPRRSLRRWLWAAGLLAAFWGGYGVTDLGLRTSASAPITPRDIDRLSLSEARLLNHLPLYRFVDDIDFLRALDHPDLFGDDRR
jgi:anti-sigma factor RsiW